MTITGILQRNVRLFIIRSFILSVYTGIYDVIFNLYILDLGFHEDFLGTMLAVSLLTSSIASVPAGILCDRFNKRKMMLLFSLLSFFSLVPLFLTSSPAVLLFFSALGGLCGSVGAVCATPLLTENCERDTVRIFSMNSAFSWMASIVGCTAGGIMPGIIMRLLPGAGQYRMAMLLALGLLLAGWSMLLLMKDGKPAPSRRKPLKIQFSPNLLRFTLISALTGVGTGAIVSYFNIYFVKVLGAGPSEIGIVFAVTNALMVVGFAITPRISSWLGKVRATTLTQMASIPFLILMALTTNFMVGSFAYTSRMFLMNLGGPALTSLQMEMIDPDERGFAIGFMSTVSGIVVAAATYLGGLFMAQGNYLVPYAATCVAYVLAACLLYRYFRGAERSPDSAIVEQAQRYKLSA
ncbi:MFS transporter [Methanocella paludicola SANAE]|uniref:MFS transporter n=1 Tax=Methanocella paludicola (strain DSM 17711 / JCM 13418 / NBRC 101707 / SANAE) TaxID=304371 RepID=D1Z1Z8_METPS|nr:MFS transporter [Methanocella paludicola]BAI62720.1 MFS transporter [Methanocella paludicola SANAE]